MYYGGYKGKVDDAGIETLIGCTLKETSKDENFLFKFTCDSATFVFYHAQDCCETVSLEEETCSAILGKKIIKAEKIEDHDLPPGHESGSLESWTNTRVHLTAEDETKAVIRFLGFSNGCYSEQVDVGVLVGE